MFMSSYGDLLRKSRNAGPLYAPTPFWEAATDRLVDDIKRDGIKNFRNRGAPLSFFVPTYGFPGNSLSPEQITALESVAGSFSSKQQAMVEAWVSGAAHALSDYRAFMAATRTGSARRLLAFSEDYAGNPLEQFKFDDRNYSRSALNYLMGLTFLAEHIDLNKIGTVLEIGGGFGTLGEILVKCWPLGTVKYIDLDIPPGCQFTDYYLSQACAKTTRMQSTESVELDRIEIDELPTLSILPNWKIEAIEGDIDLFVNFISFQEMEPEVVRNYLNHVQRLQSKWIMLRNMREGKQKRIKAGGIGVNQPILGDDYDLMLSGYEVVARDTTVFGYRTSDGFHSDLVLYKRRQ
jgi:putative sugar O-methyltransferase